jgi:hypothetical protein
MGSLVHHQTDHYSLKFLLDQRLFCVPQHQWTSKLLSFDFCVEFKPGVANVVADALSCHDMEAGGEARPSPGLPSSYLMPYIVSLMTTMTCTPCAMMPW